MVYHKMYIRKYESNQNTISCNSRGKQIYIYIIYFAVRSQVDRAIPIVFKSYREAHEEEMRTAIQNVSDLSFSQNDDGRLEGGVGGRVSHGMWQINFPALRTRDPRTNRTNAQHVVGNGIAGGVNSTPSTTGLSAEEGNYAGGGGGDGVGALAVWPLPLNRSPAEDFPALPGILR